MRKSRMLPLLAAAAMAATAFAAPATASAAEWLQEGEPLQEAKTIEFSGVVSLITVSFGYYCPDVSGEATLSPSGGEGTITGFDFNEVCPGTGELTGAQGTGEALNLPWDFDAGETTIGFDAEWNMLLSPSPPFPPNWYMKGSGITAIPDNSEEISSLLLSGEVATNWGALQIAGELDVSPAGTYGIG